jgi:hypothetical protein
MYKSLWIDCNINMIDFFIHELLIFINKYNKEFTLNTDLETFYDNFVHFLYHNYYLDLDIELPDYDSNFEYFESMYETDIIDLFGNFKDIADSFTSNIFKNRNESYSLLEFIYDNIHLENNHNIINEELFEENIDDEYY